MHNEMLEVCQCGHLKDYHSPTYSMIRPAICNACAQEAEYDGKHDGWFCYHAFKRDNLRYLEQVEEDRRINKVLFGMDE